MSSQQIYVSIELGEKTHKVGKLWFHQRGARQSASFEYDPDWLKQSEKFALDPALQLTSGSFHTTPDQILFGARSLGPCFDAPSRKYACKIYRRGTKNIIRSRLSFRC